jgi:hypothetical protein
MLLIFTFIINFTVYFLIIRVSNIFMRLILVVSPPLICLGASLTLFWETFFFQHVRSILGLFFGQPFFVLFTGIKFSG